MKLSLPKRKSEQAEPADAGVDGEAGVVEAKPSRSEKRAEMTAAAKHHSAEGGKDLAGWVDSRTNATGIYTAMLSRHVPKGTNWFYTLGSATMFIFAMQAITGVFLSMYYTPSTTQAYASITHLTNDVWMGEFVRGMHKWGASLMIILIFLHMGRTYFFGAYKYPRELNWVIGVVLLVLTTVMGLTGYLLPFDQRSLWATVVANNITASGPVVGPYLADFLRAGPEVGATTLSRFYALHMMAIPGLIAALIGAHLFLVVKLGTTAPPWVRANRPKGALEEETVRAGIPSPDDAEVAIASAGTPESDGQPDVPEGQPGDPDGEGAPSDEGPGAPDGESSGDEEAGA